MHTPASLTINAETKLRAPLHSRLAAFVRFISLLGRSSVSQVLAKAPHKPDIGKPESVVSRNARLIVCLGVGCELSAALRPPPIPLRPSGELGQRRAFEPLARQTSPRGMPPSDFGNPPHTVGSIAPQSPMHNLLGLPRAKLPTAPEHYRRGSDRSRRDARLRRPLARERGAFAAKSPHR
jgi:hypothetical protein